MKTVYKIKEMGQGDCFKLGGVVWLMLDQEEAGARALIEELMGEKPFDEGESKDWREASLKEYVNTDLLKKLKDGGAAENAITESEVNLKAMDGSEDYGKDKCRLAPLTDEQYGRYKDIIPKAPESWWLVTPYSCNEFYVGPRYSHYVRFVRPDGSLDGCMADAGLYGVRVNAILAQDVEVEIVSSRIDEEIRKILRYESPVITTETGRELDAELRKMIEETAAVCGRIPAVNEGRAVLEVATAQDDAVDVYIKMRGIDGLKGVDARTYIAVLGGKLKGGEYGKIDNDK